MNPQPVIDHIVDWLKAYAKNAGMDGFVIGISGGIDSAVTSALCARTGLKVLCVEMPIHQDPGQDTLGKAHIAHLQKTFDTVEAVEADLTETYDRMVHALPRADNPESENLALANTQSRLRMTTLYYFAGIRKLLVAGTGNKVEDFGVGFYTKYGDGGVDLSPIADLNKTEVYRLGEALGINPGIINAAPTDGLWGDQRTDEDQIGASYPELEWAMEFSGDENTLSEREKEVFDIYRQLHKQNLHKMQPVPICEISERLK